jgi:hypothetical protein
VTCDGTTGNWIEGGWGDDCTGETGVCHPGVPAPSGIGEKRCNDSCQWEYISCNSGYILEDGECREIICDDGYILEDGECKMATPCPDTCPEGQKRTSNNYQEDGVCCENRCQDGQEYITITGCVPAITCDSGTASSINNIDDTADNCNGDKEAKFDANATSYGVRANIDYNLGGKCWDVYHSGDRTDYTLPPYEPVTYRPSGSEGVPTCSDTERESLTVKNYYTVNASRGNLIESNYYSSTSVACKSLGSGSCDGISSLWVGNPAGCVAYIGDGDVNFRPGTSSYRGVLGADTAGITISPAVPTCSTSLTPGSSNHGAVCKSTFGETSDAGTKYCKVSDGYISNTSINSACYVIGKNTYKVVKCEYKGSNTLYTPYKKICGLGNYYRREITCSR